MRIIITGGRQNIFSEWPPGKGPGGRTEGGSGRKTVIKVAAYNYTKMQSSKIRPIYFRRKDKTTYAVSLKKGVSLRSLQALLSKRQAIRVENMIMIHRGKVLDSLQPLENLTTGGRENIVHVIDLAEVKRETVRFRLKGLDNAMKEYSVPAETRVKDFVKEHLARVDQVPHFYIGLVYVGKVMAPEKTFFEEFVEEDCEIVAVNLLQCVRKAAGEGNAGKVIERTGIEIQLKGGRGKDVAGVVQNEEESARLYAKDENLTEQQISPLPDSTPQTKIMQLSTQDMPKPQPLTEKGNGEHQTPQNPESSHKFQEQIEDPIIQMEHPPFNIQVSQVDSVDSEQGDHNNVKYYQEQDPFEEISSNPELNTHPHPKMTEQSNQLIKEKLAETVLTTSDFIFPGATHESQTKSFIDKLMKKYKIMFQ